MQTFLKSATALLALWLIPLYSWQFVSHGHIRFQEIFLALLTLMLVAGICAVHRHSSWVVFAWMPLMAFTGLGALYGGFAFLSLSSASSSGGASAAPLEGVATLIALAGGLVLGSLALLSYWVRPLVWPSVDKTLAAGANAVAVWLCTTAGFQASSATQMHIHLLDPEGRAVPGAAAQYEHFAEGEAGYRVFDSGGPLISDKNGLIALPSRPLRSKTRLTLTKPGYRPITLTADNQFDEYQTELSVSLGTEQTRFTHGGTVPIPPLMPGAATAPSPISLWLYLSPVSDSPEPPATRRNLYSKTDVGDQPARYLDLSTGKFSSTEPADLKLELATAIRGNRFSRPLRITDLNGAQLLLVEDSLSFAHPPSSYEQMYSIAPQTGYQAEVILTAPNARPSGQGHPTLYIRSQNGRFHARLRLDFNLDSQGEQPRYTGTLITQTSGSRVLE